MSQPLVGRFDERGGTVGRSDNATFTLPDPERMISRVQAQVLHRDDGYWIENVSAASPILHNGRPLSAGMRVQLRNGDELRIGGYTLQAAFEHGESTARLTQRLLRLLDDYGARELTAALGEALEQRTPRLASVAFILARRHRQSGSGRAAPLPVNLSRRPELEDLTVSHPSLEVYDELAQDSEKEPEH